MTPPAAPAAPALDDPKGSPRNTWKITPAEIMAGTRKYPDAARDSVRWIHNHAVKNGLTMKETAGLIGYDVSVLSRLMRGRYGVDGLGGNLDIVTGKIEQFRARVSEQGDVQRIPFILTPTAKKIHGVCDAARAYGNCAIIMGDTQKGKTMALRAYADADPQVRFFSLPPGASRRTTVQGLLRSMGGAYKSNNSELDSRLAECFDEHQCLIIDEGHQPWLGRYGVRGAHLVMELLRWLYDTTGVQIIFCGTRVFGEKMEDDGVLEQLRQRAPFVLTLPNKTPLGDVWAIAKYYSLEPPKGDERDDVRHVVEGTGLRRLTTYLQAAKVMADRKKQPVSWALFLKAYDHFEALTDNRD